MNRPDNMLTYSGMDLKLGIKSSLPHVKSSIALAILLWICANRPAELVFSRQYGDATVLSEELEHEVTEYLADICDAEEIPFGDLIEGINQNQLFKSQIEALIVAFELVWKLAEVDFVDETLIASSERKGGVRYPKKLAYSANMDIISASMAGEEGNLIRVLLSWLGFDVDIDANCETKLRHILTLFSESAVFKLSDGDREVVFNECSIYRKLLETGEMVDINGDKEPKGPLRILKSMLSEEMNPYLTYADGMVNCVKTKNHELSEYLKRVEKLLALSSTKVNDIEILENDAYDYDVNYRDLEKERISCGQNVLLYGVPGSGKSWTIEHEYCKANSIVERLVFHPDYTNADFIGQILPVVDGEKQVTYEFTEGPFTTIVKNAYMNPTEEYILIIEEINRGNAPAIFGEIFQLLDRAVCPKEEDGIIYPIGTSEYGITHKYMAERIYGDSTHKVRIPSNLSIIGTMNTSDQNVYTLDTAFQRRWKMRLIENSFNNVRSSLVKAEILDTGVTWKTFCEAVNALIVANKAKMASAEDKRLGVYFVHEDDITFDMRATPSMGYPTILVEYNDLLRHETLGDIAPEKKQRLAEIREALLHNRMFPEKVLKYLWDDAFKFYPEALFDTKSMESLEQVIRTFVYASGADRFKIFNDNARSLLISDKQE